MRHVLTFVVAAAVLIVGPAGAAIEAGSAAPKLYKNCTNLNRKYLHGLGKKGARDRTSGTPVTNFKRNTNALQPGDVAQPRP